MLDGELGRIARTIRRRQRLRQEDVAARAGVHRSTISILEQGGAGRLSLDVVRRIFDALGGKADVRPWWRGPALDRLMDERHAAIEAGWKARLEAWLWAVRAEVSYSRYGERGRIDLLAWHQPTRILSIAEVKTDLVDAQGLLGPLDVKTRLAPVIAAELHWRQPSLVVPILIFADESTVRRRVGDLAPLFTRFDLRGREAISWLRSPSLERPPSGLLIFSNLAYRASASAAPRERVRVRKQRGSAV